MVSSFECGVKLTRQQVMSSNLHHRHHRHRLLFPQHVVGCLYSGPVSMSSAGANQTPMLVFTWGKGASWSLRNFLLFGGGWITLHTGLQHGPLCYHNVWCVPLLKLKEEIPCKFLSAKRIFIMYSNLLS